MLLTRAQANLIPHHVVRAFIMCTRELPRVLKITEWVHSRTAGVNELKMWVCCVGRPQSPGWKTCTVSSTKSDVTDIQSNHLCTPEFLVDIFLAWFWLLNASEILKSCRLCGHRFFAWTKCRTLKQKIVCTLERCSALHACQKINLHNEC